MRRYQNEKQVEDAQQEMAVAELEELDLGYDSGTTNRLSKRKGEQSPFTSFVHDACYIWTTWKLIQEPIGGAWISCEQDCIHNIRCILILHYAIFNDFHTLL